MADAATNVEKGSSSHHAHGPDLRIEPGEPRDYVQDLTLEGQERTNSLLDDIDREGSPTLVPWKLWLSVTESCFPNGPDLHGIRWDLSGQSKKTSRPNSSTVVMARQI